MTMTNISFMKSAYYFSAIVFCFILFGTNAGNYFHGGAPVELIALQGAAVLIALAAMKLLWKVGKLEKIIVILFALVPSIFIAWSVLSILGK